MKNRLYAIIVVIFLIVTNYASSVTATASDDSERPVDRLADKIASECTNSSMSPFEMAVALYDYLIDNTVYKGGVTDAYQVLRKGEASCGGYANAYKLLLSKVGIKSKTINGSVFTLGHTWNLVNFDGKWYHVDVRMADHLSATEDRYRRFGMNDEQASLDYTFTKTGSKNHTYNYAYKTGALDSAIEHVREVVAAKVSSGEKLFIIDPNADGAPPTLDDPFNRILVKNALQDLSCDDPQSPGTSRVTLSLKNNMFLAIVKPPNYQVEKMSWAIPAEMVIDVLDNDFSKVPIIDLAEKVVIEPAHATRQKIFWKSYQEKTAIVDQNGAVRIVGYGKAKIKVSTTDGSKLKLILYIDVR